MAAVFKFKPENMLYILSQISPAPVGLRDEMVLKRIGDLRDPLTQTEQVLMRKPFQRYNATVAFVMCQYLAENIPFTEKPDSLIGKYEKWINILNKI